MWDAILDKILKEKKIGYFAFLDEKAKEWGDYCKQHARKEPLLDDPNASERLNIFNEVMSTNERFCLRNGGLVPDIGKKQLEKLNKIDELRLGIGIDKKSGTLLAAKGEVFLQLGNYNKAIELFKESSLVNEELGELKELIDNCYTYCDWARALYLSNRFDEAIEISIKGYELSKNLPSPDKQLEEHIKFASNPDNFLPAFIWGYFGVCDSLIHHDNWGKDNLIRRDFNTYWNGYLMEDSKYPVPQCWLPNMKLAIFSDEHWTCRLQSVADKLAQDLDIFLAYGTFIRSMRKINWKLGKIVIDYEELKNFSRIAAILIMLAYYGHINPNMKVCDIISTPKQIELAFNSAEINADPDIFCKELKKSGLSENKSILENLENIIIDDEFNFKMLISSNDSNRSIRNI